MNRDAMLRWGTLRRRKTIRRVAVYLLFLAICLEVGARVILSSRLIEGIINADHDYGRRQKWINARRDLPPDSATRYAFDAYHSERGWALKTGVRDLPVWNGKILNSNSKGLRGNTEYPYERVPNRIRIAVLGDSFTFGEEVSDHETFCAWLERLIPDSEVLNFGTRGYGHDQMLIYFRSEVHRYKPDIVILGFVYENMQRNILSFRDYAKPRFELVDDRLVVRNIPVPPPKYFLRSEWRRCKLFDLFAIIKATQRYKSGNMEREILRTTEAILGELVREITQADAQGVFVFMPVGELIGNRESRPEIAERFMSEFCSQRDGVEGFSLQPRFDAENERSVELNRITHWNAHSHAVAAAEIKRFMDEKKLLPVPR